MKPSGAATLLFGIVVVAMPQLARAVPASQLVARAHAAAVHQDWNAAAHALEELVAAGIDAPDVLYDLGTLYAHAGRYGEAIYRLEQVTRGTVFHNDAAHNLRAARFLLAHRDAARSGHAVIESALPLRLTVAEALPTNVVVAWTIGLELLAIAAFVTYRRVHGHEVLRVSSAAGCVLLVLGVLAGTTVLVAQRVAPPGGIVLRDSIQLLHDPASDAVVNAPVREGERVEVLGREATFVRVRTLDGHEGWAAARDVGLL